MITPEWIITESSEEYHARTRRGEYLSSHMLKDFMKCPRLYQMKMTGEVVDEDKPSYALGRAAHCLILEGREAFERDYTTEQPINPKTGEPYGATTLAYQTWLAGQTKEVVRPSDYEQVEILAAAVGRHAEARRLIAGIIPEGVVRTEYCGIPCQIRMDAFHPENGLIDLKTCDDVDFFPFDARKYGYWMQMAFYWAILRQVSRRYPVHIIAVEKKAPWRVRVDRLVEDGLMTSERENQAAIKRLLECRQNNQWPTQYEQIGYLTKD